MKTILIIGTLDTKGQELQFIRDLIKGRKHKTLLLDASVADDPQFPADISAVEVAKAGGSSLSALRKKGDRGAALEAMGNGAAKIAARVYAEKKIDGIIGIGGSGGTSVASTAMQAVPIGVPKVMLSTMAGGDVAPYVAGKDITMMYSVVDVAGLNRVSRRIFSNAAGAICGMVEQPAMIGKDKPVIVASMFGVTTPCVTAMQGTLEKAGYEVLVFHATGSGGRSMESLINDGEVVGVADATTTELCDELVGGVLSAGRERLDAAAQAGVPQVVSLGALDMVNFGGIESVPEKFRKRNLYVHNPQITLMRTTKGECAELGKIIADKLNKSKGPTALFIPLGGVSMIDAPGQVFYDPKADAALFEALENNINPNKVEIVKLDHNINDPEFADAMAQKLLSLLQGK